jgi:hypothetical protein
MRLTRVIEVTGPGKPVGKHAWDVRVKDLNKVWYQVRDFEVGV